VTDKELLDWLERKHFSCGIEAVVLRNSTTGRGWRLHSVTPSELIFLNAGGIQGSVSVRAAIEDAVRRERRVERPTAILRQGKRQSRS
jgi:hypothetical protein